MDNITYIESLFETILPQPKPTGGGKDF